jgi:hypothetical protein
VHTPVMLKAELAIDAGVLAEQLWKDVVVIGFEEIGREEKVVLKFPRR